MEKIWDDGKVAKTITFLLIFSVKVQCMLHAFKAVQSKEMFCVNKQFIL